MIKKVDTAAASPVATQGKRGKTAKPAKPAKRKNEAATDLAIEADSTVLERLYAVVQSRKGATPRSATRHACFRAAPTRSRRNSVKKQSNV